MSDQALTRKRQTEANFKELLGQLNPEQRQAVDQIEGVVMVLAGPGTGKTQLLAMRVANILEKTQLLPHNILCLTFTDSAVSALRRRLSTIIGEASLAVQVHTFHSFCHEIIQAWPDIFSFARELEAILEVERAELIEELVNKRPANSPLKPFGNPNLYVAAIGQAIAKLKQEHVLPGAVAAVGEELEKFCDEIEEKVEAFAKQKAKERTDTQCYELQEFLLAKIKPYPSLAGYRVRLKTATEICRDKLEIADNKRAAGMARTEYKNTISRYIRSWTKQSRKYQELALLFERYNQTLHDRGRYDFEDMILLVLEAFAQNDELLAHYQEQFQYVLVDEYQDTNRAQHELLFHLVEFAEEPNLFVVGDDKQAIFRFQGASTENILGFFERYRESIKIISLTTNYRSYQEILDGATAVIKNNDYSLEDVIPELDQGLVAVRGGHPQSVEVNVYPNEESERHGVAERIAASSAQRPSLAEIAVLCRTNREAEDMVQVLRKHDIKAELKGGKNALTSRAGRQLQVLLNFAAGDNSAECWWDILHLPSLGVDPLLVAQAAAQAHHERRSFNEVIAEKKEIIPLLKQLTRWQQRASELPLTLLLAEIMTEAKLLEYWVEQEPQPSQVQALKALYREAQQLNQGNPQARLTDYLHHLDLLKKHGLSLHAAMPAGHEAVQVMTAHRAKGLEFNQVFIMHVTDKAWGNRRVRDLLPLPAGLLPERPNLTDENEDERLLFYVALTRAKDELIVSYAETAASGRALEPSLFLYELPPEVKHQRVEVSPASLAEEISPPKLAADQEHLKQYVADQLESYRLSVTHLNNYLACPKLWLYRNILHAPARKTKYMAFGTAVHAALRDLMSQVSAGMKPGADYLVERFTRYLQREVLAENERQDVLEQGCEILRQYFKNYQASMSPDVLLEYNFAGHGVTVGGVELTGLLDKIEIVDRDKRQVKVSDYKTGLPDNKRAALKEDGEYYRQLVFYKLLCDNSPRFDYQMVSGEIDFVQPAKDGSFVKKDFVIPSQRTKELEQTITQVWQEISTLSFLNAPTCGQCDYCQV